MLERGQPTGEEVLIHRPTLFRIAILVFIALIEGGLASHPVWLAGVKAQQPFPIRSSKSFGSSHS